METKTSNLMNYESQNSNLSNYSFVNKQTPCPESFPQLMENGILLKYEFLKYSTELIEEKTFEETGIND